MLERGKDVDTADIIMGDVLRAIFRLGFDVRAWVGSWKKRI